MSTQNHDEILKAVGESLEARGAIVRTAVHDMAGDYIEYDYRGRLWAAAFGENCVLTGECERDQWGCNSQEALHGDGTISEERVSFLAVGTYIMASCDDADLIAEGLKRAMDSTLPVGGA